MEDLNDIYSDSFASFPSAMKKMDDDFNELFKKLLENLKESNDLENKYAYLLSTYGWYISANMKYESVLQIYIAIKNSDIKTAEGILLKYYRKNIGEIKKYLLEKYPERQKIISEAFKTHRQKMYFSSTILFLSQADGICEGKIFRGEKVLKKYLDGKENLEIIDAILLKESAINVDTRKEDKSNYFSDLNRHGVMHGLHSDYGNEKNSLKALSLFCFISDFTNFNG